MNGRLVRTCLRWRQAATNGTGGLNEGSLRPRVDLHTADNDVDYDLLTIVVWIDVDDI